MIKSFRLIIVDVRQWLSSLVSLHQFFVACEVDAVLLGPFLWFRISIRIIGLALIAEPYLFLALRHLAPSLAAFVLDLLGSVSRSHFFSDDGSRGLKEEKERRQCALGRILVMRSTLSLLRLLISVRGWGGCRPTSAEEPIITPKRIRKIESASAFADEVVGVGKI